ncbi:PIR Superfamily Protein [Plasmodium ovale curtisi]|uniref:PIR Superfamily Protein n=1 Tax=Plasmodium ovale curtisi TaxID=864141 RepID=A0A1A8WR63_PLAOA|nr:PIR Superfamily Protein [Plasmodium ovale curtisi]
MAPINNSENYNICNEMDYYVTNDVMINNKWESAKYKNYCFFNKSEFSDNKTEYETLCAKFKCLFDLLFDESSGFSSMYNEPHVYINFWLNYHLKNINPSSDIVQRFYEALKSDPLFDINKKLQGKIQNIPSEYLKNMIIFYELYNKYNTIYSIIQDEASDYTQCTLYSKECVEKYEEALTRCPKGTTSSFCEALNVFKGKYKKLNELIIIDNCKLEVLKPLPSHESLQQEGSPLSSEHPEPAELDNVLGEQGDTTDYSSAAAASGTMIGMFFISLILYKSTPFGPWLRNRLLQKNMIGKNIEEEEQNHELLLHMSEYQDINSEDSIYKIPYTSL